MVALFKLKTQPKNKLTIDDDERTLLTDCFKNLLGPLRTSFRTVNVKAAVGEIDSGDKEVFKTRVALEIRKLCMVLINLLDEKFLTDVPFNTLEAEVKKKPEEIKEDQWKSWAIYLKTCGDYWRYIAELDLKDAEAKRNKAKEKAKKVYGAAMTIANAKF